jgi:hypothetical protein
MKDLKIHFVLIIIFFISCFCSKNNSRNQENNGIYEIVISHELNNEIKASSFIEDYKIVQLSTSNDNLIFQISKVQYFKEKIYILDSPGNCIFIFNNDGSFYKKLNKKGSGPGEYVQITDFYIDEDNLHVLDFTQQAILRYNRDLEFMTKTNFKSHGSKFIYHNKVYWSYNEPIFKNPDYQFSAFTKEGKVVNSFLDRNSMKHEYIWSGVNAFALNGVDKYLSPQYNDTIYSITNNSIKPEFVINFKDRKFPHNENINNYDITNPSFPFLLKQNFYKSDKYLVFDFIIKSKRWFCIHDMEKKSTKSGLINNDLIKDFRFFPRWGNDGFLIEELGSEILLEHFNSSPQFEKCINVTEDDNPLIIIYKLK